MSKKNIVGNSSLQETSCEEKNSVGIIFFLMNPSCKGKILKGTALCRILPVKKETV